MFPIRQAVQSDIDQICSIDSIARHESERRENIRNNTLTGNCFVAVRDETIFGYGILNYTFFHQGWIDLIYVNTDFRRRGIGFALLSHLETVCRTSKIFTSTNLSNLPMQTLLTKSKFVLSGVIHNLDEDDPEIVYFKQLS